MSRQAANNIAVKNEGVIFIAESDARLIAVSGGEAFLEKASAEWLVVNEPIEPQ
jgi:hypothetical protein